MLNYIVESISYNIEFTGGSIKIFNRNTNTLIKLFKDHNYLYTGAISPDEKEFFGLENGKHFFVYSLETLTLKKKVTLPRGFEAIDVYGFYSDDGMSINIPSYRYVYENKEKNLGHYEYILCQYQTNDYKLVKKINLSKIDYIALTKSPNNLF